jgi:hypothetical protein
MWVKGLCGLVLSVAIVAGGGCSSGNAAGGSLDCGWLMGNNCWKSTASAAAACLPAASDTGTLSADGSTCTYASGQVVSFTPPVVLPLSDGNTWNFTVTSGGQTCLQFESTQSTSLKLVVQGKTFTETANAATGSLTYSCPDGSSVSTTNLIALLMCGSNADGGQSFGGLPGYADSWSDNSISFGLESTSTDPAAASVPVFSCSR